MIGIRFKIPNSYDTFLKKILKNINTDNYYWNIVEEEIYQKNNKGLITKKCYSNEEFKNLISNNQYYLIFLNLQASLSKNTKTILSYDDFQNNDYQLIIIVVDSIFVDIYLKDKNDINRIYKNAVDNGFEDIEYIKNNNDGRNVFTAR